MIIHNSGVILYFLMAFGSGYAMGNIRGMGFLGAWFLSIIFVPVAYELLNPSLLMLITVIGFSLGLFYAKSLFFYQIFNFLSFERFLQTRKAKTQKNRQQNFQPQFSQQNADEAIDHRKPEQILGLNTNFTDAELKAAFQRESNRTHPDKWVNKPDSIKKLMEAEQKRINWAYNKLKK